jgi:hypothetical protein
MKNLASQEHLNSPGNSPIYFEGSTHSLFQAGTEEIMHEILTTGDISLSDWDASLLGRISRYRPGLLSIDSATPTPLVESGRLSMDEKLKILTLVPGKPSQINGTDNILVLAGDVNTGIQNPTSLSSISRRALGGLLLVGALAAAGELADRKIHSIEVEKVASANENDNIEPNLTRRQFLSRLGIVTVGAITVGPNLTSRINNRYVQDVGEALAIMGDGLRPVWYPNGFAKHSDGRTAILIQKTIIASQNGLIEDSAGILMGTAHLNKSSLFSRSKEAREQSIKDMAQGLYDWSQDGSDSKEVSLRQNVSYNQMIRSQIVEIRELPEDQLVDMSPEEIIDQSVNLVNEYENLEIKKLVSPIFKQY